MSGQSTADLHADTQAAPNANPKASSHPPHQATRQALNFVIKKNSLWRERYNFESLDGAKVFDIFGEDGELGALKRLLQ